MAGFRIGRGRDDRNAQQQRQYPPPPQQAPGEQRGQQPRQQWPQVGGGPGASGSRAGDPRSGGGGRHGEPEYLGEPRGGDARRPDPRGGPVYGGPGGPAAAGPGAPQGGGQRGGGQHDPYANNPGHTQAFSVTDPYGPDGAYSQGNTYGPGGSGGPGAPPPGPRLHWKDLLRGIVMRPNATFFQMRDHAVWGPALIVTFLYGLLAVFGFDEAREQVINATFSSAIPYVLTTGVSVVVAGLILGAVTHTLARQFGGDGAWQPTVGLSMLIMSMTDAPRLLFALFLGGTSPLVQVLGWLTWVAAGVLFTSMVSRSHDLPWPRALGASAIQLIALLALFKLGTI